jgi:hypothetical protein
VHSSEIQGGCLCGGVRYCVASAPLRSMVCHCRSCRRTAASPVVAWLIFPQTHFRFTRGKPSQFNSSEFVLRTFCPSCGTPLTYKDSEEPSEICVTTCSLDDPEMFPPTYHSWLSHDLAWVRFSDGLPTFRGSRYDSV